MPTPPTRRAHSASRRRLSSMLLLLERLFAWWHSIVAHQVLPRQADCCCRPGSGQTADRGRGCGSGCSKTHHASGTGSGRWTSPSSRPPAAGSGGSAQSSTTPPSTASPPPSPDVSRPRCARLPPPGRCPGAERGVMDVVDADDYVIGEAPAPIAVVTDNGPCFRGVTFADAFAGDDPLFRPRPHTGEEPADQRRSRADLRHAEVRTSLPRHHRRRQRPRGRGQPVPPHLRYSATPPGPRRTHTTRGLPRRRTLR